MTEKKTFPHQELVDGSGQPLQFLALLDELCPLCGPAYGAAARRAAARYAWTSAIASSR